MTAFFFTPILCPARVRRNENGVKRGDEGRSTEQELCICRPIKILRKCETGQLSAPLRLLQVPYVRHQEKHQNQTFKCSIHKKRGVLNRLFFEFFGAVWRWDTRNNITQGLQQIMWCGIFVPKLVEMLAVSAVTCVRGRHVCTMSNNQIPMKVW